MRTRSRRVLANILYLRKPTKQFLPILAGLALVVFLGGAVFSGLYGKQDIGYWRGVYITYCLIFMEHLVEFPDDWVLRFMYFVLPPLGLAVILDGIVSFSYHILRRDELSSDWVKAMSATMKNHVIMFGLGKLGLRILQELDRLNELVVVVERDANCPNIPYAQRRGVPVRIGVGREEGLLEELNIEHAKSLIMATDDDLANLEVAIDARQIKPGIRIVLRMFDQDLAEKIKESFDIHLAFSTWQLAAPLFATSSSDRSIVNSFYVGEQLMVVARVTVLPGSTLAGRKVSDLRNEYDALVLEVRGSGGATFIPDLEVELAIGDAVTLQTRTSDLKRIHEANGDYAEMRV